jgi:hypothetical protein
MIATSSTTANVEIMRGFLVTAFAPTIFASYTVSGLPAANTYAYGIAFVTDANQAAGTSLGTTPTGSGAVVRAVYSNGTSWLLL